MTLFFDKIKATDITKYLSWILVVIQCIILAALVLLRLKLIFVPIADLGGVEQNVVYGIQRLMSGYDLYQNPEDIPFSIIQYSPLHYLVVSQLASIFGVIYDDVYGVYVVNRACCLLFNLISVTVVWLISKRLLNSNSILALFIATTTFCYFTSGHYGRPDSLYNLFFVCSFYCLILSAVKKTKIVVLIGGFCMLLAIASKQSGIILIPCWLLCISINYSGKDIIQLLIAGALTLVVSCVIVGIDSIELFYQNAVGGVSNGIDIAYFLNKYLSYFSEIGIWILSSIFCMAYLIHRQKKLDLILAISTLLLLSFSLVTSLKFGSGSNYYSEYLIVSFWLIAYILKIEKKQLNQKWLLVVIFSVFTYQSMFRSLTTIWRTNYKIDFGMLNKERKVSQFVLGQIDTDRKVLIFDDPIVRYRGYLANLLHNHTLFMQKSVFDCCSTVDKYDFSLFSSYLESGIVQYIIVKERELPESYMRAEFKGKFQKQIELNGYNIYRYSL